MAINTIIKAQTHAHEIGFQTDNDGYLAQGSDRYYTNGIFINYRQALSIPADSRLANKVLGFEIGQKMYNPQTGGIPDPIYIDRPFAGYLYAGSTLNLLYKNETSLKLGVQAGVIGPASYARQTQEFIHRTFGFYPPTGWQYQVRNNFVLNLSAEYVKLLARSGSFDVSADGYANIGTGFIGAGVGPLFRLGDLNKLFNSASTQSAVSKKGNNNITKQREFFLYYKPQINYVGYDATVEGGIFETPNYAATQELTLSPNRVMLSNQIGGDFTNSRWTVDFSVIFHTKDVPNMVYAHQWGSLAVMYHFN